MKNSLKCLFIVPHFSDMRQSRTSFLKQTVQGFFDQTDQEWSAIVIDDASVDESSNEYMDYLERSYSSNIKVVRLTKNSGPGFCRNIGIEYAKHIKADVVMFNDDDDISHPDRVALTKEFFSSYDVGVLYSSFKVIDEDNVTIDNEAIPKPIMEILNTHNNCPVEGALAWKRMGTETGYTNTTSATSVSLKYQQNCYFPNVRASEDFHTWMRLSGIGALYKYTSKIPCLYRVPRNATQQASRIRLGNRKFNELKVVVDSDGFTRAMEMALLRGDISNDEVMYLFSRFYKRLAVAIDDEPDLYEAVLDKALMFEEGFCF